MAEGDTRQVVGHEVASVDLLRPLEEGDRLGARLLYRIRDGGDLPPNLNLKLAPHGAGSTQDHVYIYLRTHHDGDTPSLLATGLKAPVYIAQRRNRRRGW